MKKFIMSFLFAITLIVHNQYVVDGQLFVDYSLNGDEYTGVYYEDMYDNLNSTLELSYDED